MANSGSVPSPNAVTAVATAVAELKPRLRGWLHTYAAGVSVVTGVVLAAVAGTLRGGPAGATTGVYAATVTALFGISALYHRINWSPPRHRLMKRLDHSMIFVFIAGTYTPIAALTLTGAARIAVLSTVWAGALSGVTMRTAWPSAPRWLTTACYVGLGWVAIFVFPQLIAHAGIAAFVLIAAGGVVYTIGGVFYALKRPDPWPSTFGFHEVFHLCTLVAALCHYVAIWLAVFA